MKKVSLFVSALAVVSLISGIAGAAEKSAMRFGVGLGMSQIDARLVLNDKMAAGVFLGENASIADTGGTDYNSIVIGGQFFMKLVNAKPADLHVLAGASVDTFSWSNSAHSDSTTTVSLFGGIGSEYFLPGTENLSIEMNVGIKLDVDTSTGGSTDIGTDSLGGVTFHYYFN